MKLKDVLDDSILRIDQAIKETKDLTSRLKATGQSILDVYESLGLDCDIDYECIKEDTKDEQEETYIGWVVVDPCPPRMRGIDHYFSDSDKSDDSWSGEITDAVIYETKDRAEEVAKLLEQEGDTHFPRKGSKSPKLRVERKEV